MLRVRMTLCSEHAMSKQASETQGFSAPSRLPLCTLTVTPFPLFQFEVGFGLLLSAITKPKREDGTHTETPNNA